MKRIMGVALVAFVLSGCDDYVTRTEFNQHVADYDALQASYDRLIVQLTQWSQGMYTWAGLTGNVICEVARTNRPLTQYPQRTQDYCGSGDPPGNPPPPPQWGQ